MDQGRFFASIRSSVFQGSIPQSAVDGINLILSACDRWGVVDEEERSYVLATVIAEVGRKMLPVPEVGRGRGKKYGNPGRNRGQVPYGRGFVQLTWDDNYEELDAALGYGGRLIANYDLALRQDVAADILVVGMRDGLFSPRGDLSDYLGANVEDWTGARYTVNVQDRAAEIAGIARKFDAAFEAAGYRPNQEPNENPLPTPGPVEPPSGGSDPGRDPGSPRGGLLRRFFLWLRDLLDRRRIRAGEDRRDP